nr:WAT1-related protein At1g70260-like [Ipomoea batatas]
MLLAAMEVKAAFGEVVPCMAMVMLEACTIFLTIMASTAMAKFGTNPLVFVVYTNALASIILVPYSIIYHRRDKVQEKLFTFPLLLRLFFLGLIGVTISQNLAFVGLSYSSPIAACGTANIVPALSFILAIILRRTKIDWKSGGSQARMVGALICTVGTISLLFYRGPVVKNYSPTFLHLSTTQFVFSSKDQQNWVLGCLFFIAASLSLSIWNIIQVGTIKIYPQVMKIMCVYSLFGTVQSGALSLFIVRDPNAWRLDLNFQLIVIVLTAIFGSIIRSSVQLWCMRMKGPSFPLIFKPVGIVVASSCGCLFFADTFHYGSMFSAFICGMGYYTTIWGQFKDEETQQIKGSSVSLPDEKVPLLRPSQDDLPV